MYHHFLNAFLRYSITKEMKPDIENPMNINVCKQLIHHNERILTMKREILSYLKAYDYFSNKVTLLEENFKQKSKFLTKLVYKNTIKRLGILLFQTSEI